MKPIHKNLHSMEDNEIRQRALDYLTNLLTKVPMNVVVAEYKITARTFYRWLDEELSLEQIALSPATRFVLITETSPRVQDMLNRAPMDNAYFGRQDD